MPAARGAPVTLRDFLELRCESSSDGFRSYPRRLPCDDDAGVLQAPVRLLIEAHLRRSPSRSPSSFFLPKSPGALARISSLSQSFSRRIRGGFWRRREDDDDEVYFDERDSFGLPSPLVSSCSASESGSEYGESEAGITAEETPASAPASECEKSSSSSADHDCTDAPGAGGHGQKAALDGDSAVGRNMKMEDKQQLSPVSVLDFPFDDDDGDEGSDASPSFQHCPADLQRTKAQLLHKIRRYDGLAEAVDPVDLDARFTTSESGESVDARVHLASNSCTTDSATTTAPRHGEEEHQSMEQSEEQEPDECRLLGRLLEDTAAVDDISEALLLDFFAEGVGCHRSAAGSVVGTVKPTDDLNAAALIGVASEWLRGAGPRWGIGDVVFSGEAALADMERSRRWMCVREEERDVGAAVEGLVMDGLVTELAAWWCGDRRWN
ncbi:uncharacterized protein LOC133917075 [Phragmites australis]|uniref:uncharacterized protein LOC133917075 n=1 Tax=Phragmites australis TaxID=29695 RepID=UPI002D79786C|nr:uncharacterized protein LOC133917075 [Phragmites australis]